MLRPYNNLHALLGATAPAIFLAATELSETIEKAADTLDKSVWIWWERDFPEAAVTYTPADGPGWSCDPMFYGDEPRLAFDADPCELDWR